MAAADLAPAAAAVGAAPDVLTVALEYAARGWPVHPLDGKRPLLRDWPSTATTDADRIAAWWQRRPRSNVGVVTGWRSALVVLDVDDGGADALLDLQRRHGRLPDAGWVRTGSGGWHLYLEHPGRSIRNSVRGLGDGLDVRADGGQVVAPPSRHPDTGGPYRWLGEPVAAPMPGWLAALVCEPTRPPVRPSRWQPPARAGDPLDPLARTVAGAAEGNRNATLFWAACRAGEHVARHETTRDDAETRLADAAAACGLAAREAAVTIRSGLEHGGGA